MSLSAGGIEIAAEWFFDDDPGVAIHVRRGQPLSYFAEEAGGNGKIMEGALGGADCFVEGFEGLRVAVVAVDVLEEGEELVEGGAIDAAVLGEALAHALLEAGEVPAGLGDADDRDV